MRERHGRDEEGRLVTTWPCPEPTCKRHLKGFPRRTNLQYHCQKIHGYDTEGKPLTSELGLADLSSSEYSDSASTACNSPQLLAQAIGSCSMSHSRKPEAGLQPLMRGMQSRLSSMERKRRLLDTHIDTLKHTLAELDVMVERQNCGLQSSKQQRNQTQRLQNPPHRSRC